MDMKVSKQHRFAAGAETWMEKMDHHNPFKYWEVDTTLNSRAWKINYPGKESEGFVMKYTLFFK